MDQVNNSQDGIKEKTDWIDTCQDNVDSIYQSIKDGKENALSAYCVYLMRLLNGLRQMKYSQIYQYEKNILEKAMELFCKYFEGQVAILLERNLSIFEKTAILRDIETALYQMSNVLKNVVDNTSNSDRQMFTSQAVETNIYELSPKFFRYYSCLLQKLVDIYGKREVYAFVLHPSIRNNFETFTLFEKRRKTGKIVLIYIPERQIDEIEMMPIYLLHEAYHVLTKSGRCRKKRASMLYVNIMSSLQQFIFENVDFRDFVSADDEKINQEMQVALMECWIDMKVELNYLTSFQEDDHIFYSEEVGELIADRIHNQLQNALNRLGRDLIGKLAEYVPEEAVEFDFYEKLRQTQQVICNNILRILIGNWVWLLMDRYLILYREAYADVACVLTMQIGPELYDKVFSASLPFRIPADSEEDRDVERDLRNMIVARAVAPHLPGDLSEKWTVYGKSKREKITTSKPGQGDGTGSAVAVSVRTYFTVNDQESFNNYFADCTAKIMKFFEEHPKIREFREIVRVADREKILSGEMIELLDRMDN